MEKTHMGFKKFWARWNIIYIMAGLKLLIHFFTNTTYGFHRDEFLYIELGNHLGWGFMEVPPVIAVLGKVILWLGGSVFVTRLFPALIGSLTVLLIGYMVHDLGGRKWAQFFATLAFILSPAFLRSNTLFQPVSFNQFCWFLSAFFIVRLIKYQQAKYWIYLGVIAGLGFLTKYSIVFFYAAFFASIFFTPERKWLKTKYPYIAVVIAFVIALPNLFWQYQHNWPIIHHMKELAETQLVHVEPLGFIVAQLMMHQITVIIWLAGLLYLFFGSKLSAYRILGWMYVLVIILLALLSGKAYYTLGAYAMLMAAGGMAIEIFLENKNKIYMYGFTLLLIILTLPAFPYGIPVLSIEKMERYCAYMSDQYGLSGPLYWEDGKRYSIPQDYADMFGWEEMAERVSKLYHSLPADSQQTCLLLGGSYSHAGVINYYREKYNLPEIYSFNGSHLIWMPDSCDFNCMIMVDDVYFTEIRQFQSLVLVDSIRNQYAREPGYIYYLSNPTGNIKQEWQKLVANRKKEFNF